MRKKDCKIKSKKQKSVLLTEKNFLILKEMKKYGIGFNFNKFVNDCIFEKLYSQTEEEVLSQQIENLATERDLKDQEYGLKAQILATKLMEIKAKKELQREKQLIKVEL